MAFFSLLAKKNSKFLVFWLKKEPNISQILLKLWLIGNRTSCRPIRSVIIPVIKQIGLPLLITRMITDPTGLHSVLLPLLIIRKTWQKPQNRAWKVSCIQSWEQLGGRAWKQGWSMVYYLCSLLFRQIYHRSTSFPNQYVMKSMVYCSHPPK